MMLDKKCIIVDDEQVAREILATHLSKIQGITNVAECKNAIEAFNYLTEHKVDLILLDINMPEISGIAFAKSINKDVKIIFTTAYRDFAVEGFELRAVDYLLKPISFERLLKAITTYFEVYTSSSDESANKETDDNEFLFVRSDRKMVKIEYESILYIESYSDYIKIVTDKKTVVTRENISSMESKLPKKEFLRIHRSYIIALNHINSFTNEYVSVNGKDLSISRSYKKFVLKKLNTY